MDDAELLAASARGDADAFATFYRRHLAKVVGFCLHENGSREAAADLTAEVFAAALEASGRYEPRFESAAPWLLGHASAVYGLVAVLAGVLLAALARRLHGAEGARADQAARQLFAYSVLYLFVLFAMLLIDQGLGGLFGRAAA